MNGSEDPSLEKLFRFFFSVLAIVKESCEGCSKKAVKHKQYPCEMDEHYKIGSDPVTHIVYLFSS